jgi:dTDP-L-rhamnose 4-epimerase
MPESVYAVTKRDQEELALTVGRAYRIPTVALRFFNVYGPRQALSNPYTGVAAIFSARLLNGRPPVVYEDGRQTRDFIHVRDVARACRLALERDGANYEAVNIGTGRPVPVLEVARTLARALGRPIEPEVAGRYRAGDIRHCYADIARARRLLGFEPEVAFEAGMGGLAAWVAGQAAEDRWAEAAAELERRGLTR